MCWCFGTGIQLTAWRSACSMPDALLWSETEGLPWSWSSTFVGLKCALHMSTAWPTLHPVHSICGTLHIWLDVSK